ncbi:TatD family hydrolase [Ideonella sp. 4Y11]|uniref:TatD family hydrolase n=1 Tax=Ideonella aquatica TaxID=2824119 RepID=A0A941BG41_9BURK|nr:TatD family hydrolase [Ideonella aquatica]MBQ0959426.1 TatD family hydrolase [Ideonella aquatica]
MFVDSHCHLSFPGLRERLPEVLRDMQAAQVRAALVICTTVEEFPEVSAIAHTAPYLWASVGVHPDNEGVHEPSVDELLQLAHGDARVVAIGETGLDYYRLGGRSIADMAWQRERFRVHIRAALAADLPLIIHTRSASDDTLAILREEGQGRVRGVFHCFTETVSVARAALDLGFHVSLSGIVTFRNAGELREVARMLPLERLLIETDSPYLAPVPYRGKTNTPAYVPHVAAEIARERGAELAQIAEASTRNFERLFGVQIPQEHA